MAGGSRINHRRLKLLSVIVLLVVIGIVLKLSDLMILQAESISDKAESQWTREMDVIPKRGKYSTGTAKCWRQARRLKA